MSSDTLTKLALAVQEAKRRGLLGHDRTKPKLDILTYFDRPAQFVLDCIKWPDGKEPAAYQLELLNALTAHRRVASRGPHGIGKTTVAALALWWFALTRDAAATNWKVVTTASAWRQLTKFLWPEVHKWKRHIRWSHIGRPMPGWREMGIQSMKLTYGQAFPVASSDPGKIEGAHEDQMLYIFDEAKMISNATFDAAEGAFASGQAYALAISTPGDASGRFFEIHKRAPGFEDWWVRHVTLAEAIQAERVNPVWADQRRQQWGEASSVYKNRVLGEFAASQERGTIPLEWVELANERWATFQEKREEMTSRDALHLTCLGVDVGHGGLTNDAASIARCYNGHIIDDVSEAPITDPRIATMELVGHVGALLGLHKGAEAIVDVIGLGDGVYARLLEQGYRARGHNASFKTAFTDVSGMFGFENWRSAGWWLLRELLDPTNKFEIALPPNDRLIGELVTPQFSYTSASKIRIEGKDTIRKRLSGHSTDYADAVIHALIGPLLCDERENELAGVQTRTQVLEPRQRY